jgi:magnesium chelatase subunit H
VYRLYEQLLEVEQRLIPVGMHIFGRISEENEIADMLRMVASFDRPEHGARALPNLICEALSFPPYSVLMKESAHSKDSLSKRERVEKLMRESVAKLLVVGTNEASLMLYKEASVPVEESRKVFEMLSGIRKQLSVNSEMESLMRALRGEYIEPGPGADIVQNPDILPTGRNTHAIDPYRIPSPVAAQRAEPIVSALLERHLKENGRYPETLAMVLWGTDNIKTQGEAVAQALLLLGASPRRDGLNRATEIEVIPLEKLGKPRIDVVMTVYGIFRAL